MEGCSEPDLVLSSCARTLNTQPPDLDAANAKTTLGIRPRAGAADMPALQVAGRGLRMLLQRAARSGVSAPVLQLCVQRAAHAVP
jgi:hypothetical protein